MTEFEKFAFNNFLIYGKNLVRIEDVERFYNEYRTTKRALWLARAERAKAMAMHHFTLSMQHKMLFGKTDSYRAEQHDLWSEIERKCMEKAEEYR